MSIEFNSIIRAKPITTIEGVFILSDYLPATTHEQLYLKVREKEGRVLTDDLVKKLPNLPSTNIHYQEWQLRKQTSDLFCKFLTEQKKATQILDLGCGNGWFSAKMASISGIEVVGLDLNLPELKQAQRLFENKKLIFCYGNIFDSLFKNEVFDKIVISAAVQYFYSIEKLFAILFQLLKPDGEIHILDSPFYKTTEVKKASLRTINYYQSIDYYEMAKYYFHHSFEDINNFKPEFKKEKNTILETLLKKPKNPFPWVIVKKNTIN